VGEGLLLASSSSAVPLPRTHDWLPCSKALHELAKSPVKELHVYPGMYHALLSEPDGGAEKVRTGYGCLAVLV